MEPNNPISPEVALKRVAERISRAKGILNRHDPVQGSAWRELDSAEAHLQALAVFLHHGKANG